MTFYRSVYIKKISSRFSLFGREIEKKVLSFLSISFSLYFHRPYSSWILIKK